MKVTLETYKLDKYYPSIVRVVERILQRSNIVAPVEVFIEMQVLSREDYDRWRRGNVPYLEKVIKINLSRASRILRILRFHAHDLDMVPSTHSMKWKDAKQKKEFRFSKTGAKALEDAYSRHFIWNKTNDKKPSPVSKGLSKPKTISASPTEGASPGVKN